MLGRGRMGRVARIGLHFRLSQLLCLYQGEQMEDTLGYMETTRAVQAMSITVGSLGPAGVFRGILHQVQALN